MIHSALRFARTARFLSARQIAVRVSRAVERRTWRVMGTRAPHRVAPPLREHQPLWDDVRPNDATLARAAQLIDGTFTFLGESRPVSWSPESVSRLWLFHLHYFDYLRDLAVYATNRQRPVAFRAFRDLSASWIETHGKLGDDAWHPYTVSLRLVNWCEAAIFFHEELLSEPAFRTALHDSIASHADFLAGHIEEDVRGNHVLENARALVRASTFFEGDLWLRPAVNLLEREIPEQILSDGGHFERAPGYHLRVLCVLEDIQKLHPMPFLEHAVGRMREFLAVIVPPNGRLPLLKDTALPDAPIAAGTRDSRWLEPSGYAVIRDDRWGDHLIADFGRVCPDYLPAHAHADMFSYELTIGGRPVVADSGVFEYAEGEWRSWFRSTAAHNTVAVDGLDQSEMWGSFRVGRRASPQKVQWLQQDGMTAIIGEHDGYAPSIHRRAIVCVPDARLWLVMDRVSELNGRAARSFVHLHPGAPEVLIEGLGNVRRGETHGWYSEHFGQKRRNRVLTFEAQTASWFGYVIGAETLRADAVSRAVAWVQSLS